MSGFRQEKAVKKRVGFYLSEEAIKALTKKAKEQDRSLSNYLENLLKDHLDDIR